MRYIMYIFFIVIGLHTIIYIYIIYGIYNACIHAWMHSLRGTGYHGGMQSYGTPVAVLNKNDIPVLPSGGKQERLQYTSTTLV